MMIALALVFFGTALTVWYLHRKIGYYKRLKEQHDEMTYCTTFTALETALRAIRRFSKKYYPEGQPRLDMASYSLSQYLKHMRWLAAKQQEGDENIARSIEESKLNEIEQ